MGKKYKKGKILSGIIKDKKVNSQIGRTHGMLDEIASLKEYFRPKGISLVSSSNEELNRDMLETVVEVAVDLWRIGQRLKANEIKMDAPTYLALNRPLESAFQKLRQRTIDIVDRVNKAYDPGMDEKVLATEERPGSSFDLVAETIKPTIYYKEAIIGRGEIIVGVPPKSRKKKETSGG